MGKLVSLAEYAAAHGKSVRTIQQKAKAGGFQTARLIGRFWMIDKYEPYVDLRRKENFNPSDSDS